MELIRVSYTILGLQTFCVPINSSNDQKKLASSFAKINETLSARVNESPQAVFTSCHSQHLQTTFWGGGGGVMVFRTFDAESKSAKIMVFPTSDVEYNSAKNQNSLCPRLGGGGGGGSWYF